MTGPLAVYLHIPFCTIKCGYCDFNAYAGMDNLKDAYAAALVAEVAADRPLLEGRSVSSIGFGGGTPGEMAPRHIANVIGALRSAANLVSDAEVSLEANPGSTGGAVLRELHAAGVTRITFGAQSFDADELRFLDRIHSPEAIRAAVSLARAANFRSVGLDLIHGLPGQSVAEWLASVRTAIGLGVDHLSCYALTVEDGTALGARVARGEFVMPDGDLLADMYEAASDALAAAGYVQYELSNWAQPGHESRHNRAYWTDQDYLALGAGGHGYLAGERYENVAHPRAYIAAVASSAGPRPAAVNRYVPGRATAMSDWFTARLRLIEGFPPEEFAAKFGQTLETVGNDVLHDMAGAGVLERGPRVRLTPRGRLLHGEVCARFLAALQENASVAS